MGGPEGAERQYRRGETITEQPRPRVLLLNVDDSTLAPRLRDKIPTLAEVETLRGIDLHEWDCIVTNEDYTSLEANPAPPRHGYGYSQHDDEKTWTWKQHFPSHISVMYAPTSRYGLRALDILDFQPRQGEDEDELPLLVLVRDSIDGKHISYVEGLPPEITELVKERLVPVARERATHTTFEVRDRGFTGDPDLRLRPFLFGPREVPLAGSYERTNEASAWLLPPDVGDLAPWVLAALREWHSLYPERFPGVPDWTTESRYHSSAEVRLHQELDARAKVIQEEIEKYLADKKEIQSRLSEATEEATHYERTLLTATGDKLAQVVARALRDLGFSVQDMDEVWEPQKRREDYRITDSDDAAWLAVGEAKGFTKGMKETGLVSLGRWIAMFAADEGRLPSAQWYIANQYLRDDPDVRPDPLATRSDVLKTFTESNGLVIDTRALYALLRAVQDNPSFAQPIRQRLREARGVLRARDADSLLTNIADPAS